MDHMARKLQLQIPTPCHENWEKMTQSEKGRFCAACQKQVIDFSHKSDREIAMFFKRTSTGPVCGRFMDDQLNRNIEIPKKRIPWLKYFFQFLIPALFISYRATAQGKVKVGSGVTIQPSKLSSASQNKKLREKTISGIRPTVIGDTTTKYVPKDNIDIISKTPQIDAVSCSVVMGVMVSEIESFISGQVVDHSGNPIAFATVAIKGTKIAVAADAAGQFTISPKRYAKNLTLSVSSAGFAAAEKNIHRFESWNNIKIELQQTGTLGEVVVTSSINSHRLGLVGLVESYRTYPVKTNDISKFKDNFKLYPNPVSSNSTLNVEWKQNQYGDHVLQVFNQSGQLVVSKEINIGEGSRLFTMTMPSIASGNYFLKLTSKATGKSYTEKLIVE